MIVKPKTNDKTDVESPANGEVTASSTKTSITDDDFDNRTLASLSTTANKKKADKPTTTTTTPSASSTDVVPTDGETAADDSTSPDGDVTLVETALNTPEQAMSVEHLATHFLRIPIVNGAREPTYKLRLQDESRKSQQTVIN